MASPTASRIATAPAELPDAILEDIFLRLDPGPDLARASATCRAFRRVATARHFLRRFTSLHPPPVAGFTDFEGVIGLDPAEPPHRSACALAQAGNYRFSFLPDDARPKNGWRVCDVRDGRFLLAQSLDATAAASTFLELVVCDPWYHRYLQIPPIPGDVVPRTPSIGGMKSEPFFAPADEGGSEENLHFRVIYNWLSNYKIVTFLFSSATGKWCCATTFRFLPARLILEVKELERYYAHGCFHWASPWEEYMLLLDPREMKFSLVPHDEDCLMGGPGLARGRARPRARGLVVMDAAEDKFGFLTLKSDTLYLYTEICQNNGYGPQKWRLDKSISLPGLYYNYFIIGADEGYLLLGGVLRGAPRPAQGEQKIQCFVVNLKTLLVEELCVLNGSIPNDDPYAGFPPPLSLPSLKN